VEGSEKTAATAEEEQALAKRRQALEARPKVALPIGMDFEKLGWDASRFRLFAWLEVTTAVLLDVLMLVAGIALVRRRVSGITLGLAAAAAKLVRLFLVYGFVALVIVPPLARGAGRGGLEAVAREQE